MYCTQSCQEPAVFGVSLAGGYYLPLCWRHALEKMPMAYAHGKYQGMTVEFAPLAFAFPDED